MSRLPFALSLMLLPVPAWSQPASAPDKPAAAPSTWQVREMAPPARRFTMESVPDLWKYESRTFATTGIAPGTTFGFGQFGLKSERSRLAPVTVLEVNSPRTRRAAVGVSFKF